MKRLQRIFWVFLVLVILQVMQPALAQSPGVEQTPTTPSSYPSSQTPRTNLDIVYENNNPNVQRNIHTLSQNIVIEALATTTCLLAGIDPVDPTRGCLGIDMQTRKIGYTTDQSSGGLIGFMGNMIAATYSIPISTSDYMAYSVSNFGIAKQANAQALGPGFQGLQPLLKIWVASRNIAYLIFVILFTLLGLAIILRVKVDARTVMSIQNQIPKVVVALVLVTFSYAIAALLIDLMYISIYLLLITFNNVSSHPNPSIFKNIFSYTNSMFAPTTPVGGDFLGIMSMTWNISKNVQQVLTATFDSLIPTEIGYIISPIFAFLALGANVCDGLNAIGVGGAIDRVPGISDAFGGACNFAQNYPAILIGAIGQLLAFLVVLVAILFTLFRVWFSLIKSFCFVIVDTIIGPLWITLGLFPGATLGFGKWFRHLIAHLAMFPTVIAVLLAGKAVMDAINTGGLGSPAGQSDLFSPPLLGNIGGNNALAAFVGFGFILSIPQLMEKVKNGLQAPNFGLKAIQQSLGAGFASQKESIGAAVTYKKGLAKPGDKGASALLSKYFH